MASDPLSIPFDLTDEEERGLRFIAARYQSAAALLYGLDDGRIDASDAVVAFVATGGDGGDIGVVPLAGGSLGQKIQKLWDLSGAWGYEDVAQAYGASDSQDPREFWIAFEEERGKLLQNTSEFDEAWSGGDNRPSVATLLDERRRRAEQGNWVPASGGQEEPFWTRSGRRLQYLWQPSTGKHAYIDLDTDLILSNEEAEAAFARGAEPSLDPAVERLRSRRATRNPSGQQAIPIVVRTGAPESFALYQIRVKSTGAIVRGRVPGADAVEAESPEDALERRIPGASMADFIVEPVSRRYRITPRGGRQPI
jgi:hypothetical protein